MVVFMYLVFLGWTKAYILYLPMAVLGRVTGQTALARMPWACGFFSLAFAEGDTSEVWTAWAALLTALSGLVVAITAAIGCWIAQREVHRKLDDVVHKVNGALEKAVNAAVHGAVIEAVRRERVDVAQRKRDEQS
jgi:hypothetical protein